MQSIGVNPASVSYGSAHATVGGADVLISAMRAAGGSGAAVWDQMARLTLDEPPVVTAGNLGGKPVTIVTDSEGAVSDGGISYWYFNGEYVWSFRMEEAQAAVVLAALP